MLSSIHGVGGVYRKRRSQTHTYSHMVCILFEAVSSGDDPSIGNQSSSTEPDTIRPADQNLDTHRHWRTVILLKCTCVVRGVSTCQGLFPGFSRDPPTMRGSTPPPCSSLLTAVVFADVTLVSWLSVEFALTSQLCETSSSVSAVMLSHRLRPRCHAATCWRPQGNDTGQERTKRRTLNVYESVYTYL